MKATPRTAILLSKHLEPYKFKPIVFPSEKCLVD